jgi:hypothetical protein
MSVKIEGVKFNFSPVQPTNTKMYILQLKISVSCAPNRVQQHSFRYLIISADIVYFTSWSVKPERISHFERTKKTLLQILNSLF